MMGERKARPPLCGPVKLVYDWLAENGVNEWLPENPRIVVAGQQIVFTAFVWVKGPAGWDHEHMHPDMDTITRTVPLLKPPPPAVVEVLVELELFADLHGREPVVR